MDYIVPENLRQRYFSDHFEPIYYLGLVDNKKKKAYTYSLSLTQSLDIITSLENQGFPVDSIESNEQAMVIIPIMEMYARAILGHTLN